MNADLRRFRAAAKRIERTTVPCPACKGVGCLPEHFGIGNPDPKPCTTCKGVGFIHKEKPRAV